MSVALAACSRDDKSFRLVGDIANMPEQEIRLVSLGIDDKLVVVDSTRSDEKGHFELKGQADEPSIYQVRFERSQADFLLLSLKNDEAKVKGSWPDLPTNYTVEGSPASSSLRGFLQVVRTHMTDLNSLMVVNDTLRARGNDSMLANAEADITRLKSDLTRYIETYSDTTRFEANALFTVRWLNPLAEEAFINNFNAGLAKRFPNSPTAKRFVERFRESMKMAAQMRAPTQTVSGQGGSEAKEISLPDPNGRTISLSSLRGKWVLLDFWASWCGPCRAENPNVVAAYNAYKDKNFTVFGVSLDEDKDAWVKAIQKDGLTWTHVSDLKRWESIPARDYGVEGIPANFLIDPQGNVVARNLRGPELQAKLAELIK